MVGRRTAPLLAITLYLVAGCGGDEPSRQTDNPTMTALPSIPDYVPPAVRQEWLRALSPPPGMTAVLFWGVAIHDTRQVGTSEVLIDWQRMVCRVGERDVEVDRNDFDRSVSGGLCAKRPWCADMSGSLPATIDAARGVAILRPASSPEQVFHWWGTYAWPEGRPAIPAGASRCWTEARVKVTGPALVQIGFDWYPGRTGAGGASGGVVEGAVSNWISASGDWQKTSVAAPN